MPLPALPRHGRLFSLVPLPGIISGPRQLAFDRGKAFESCDSDGHCPVSSSLRLIPMILALAGEEAVSTICPGLTLL